MILHPSIARRAAYHASEGIAWLLLGAVVIVLLSIIAP